LSEIVLEAENLCVSFELGSGWTPALQNVSFRVAQGEMLAVVGESGCGKSLMALSLLGLTPPPGKVTAGAVRLEGKDLLSLDEKQLRHFRGFRIAMIFQEPAAALNPVLTIGEQIMEGILEHERVTRRAARERTLALLEKVRMPDPERRFGDFPHRMSGGMRQRAMIAMALACSPAVLVADEPTTALDVTIQAQILELIDELRRENGTAVVFISHDLALVSEYADRVLVMYAGCGIEEREAQDLFAAPGHPYTIDLIAARPQAVLGDAKRRLTEIPGSVPSLEQMPGGCAFAPRCKRAREKCREERPPFVKTGKGGVACHFLGDAYVI
jgi:peptide/nickel transport system ATP-binding protein